ncbi:hypothetical protein KAW50_01505 [candidate division WOR-3 bacterium]|nr:hypothetical protein [candidate division WOR-3 bacterium]
MVNINWEELCEAIGDYSQTRYYFLNKLTGELLVLSEYMSEAGKMELRKKLGPSKLSDYMPVKMLASREGYKMMEDFVEVLYDVKLKEHLKEALSSENPFKKFKDLVMKHPEERIHWLEFRQKKLREQAEMWLKQEGVI